MKYDFSTTLDHRANHSFKWEQPEGRNDVIGMETADMDFACPPCIKAAMLPVLEENTYNYRKRPPEYFRALLGWYQRRYQLTMEKSWLTSVPGTIGAIQMALRTFAGEGAGVIVQMPCFGPVKNAIDMAGCKLIENPVHLQGERYEIDFADFEEKIRLHRPAMYLMVNPHNPTGRVFTRQELERLVAICKKYGVMILSDEVHSLIVYDNHVHTPIHAVNQDARDISLLITSLSKAFNIMSLPHAIIAIANPQLQARWKQQIIAYSFGYATNPFGVAAVTSIAKGEADQWLEEVTAYLKTNCDQLIDFIREKHLPLRPIRPEGGYLMWVDCRPWGRDPATLADVFLNDAGIRLYNGADFGKVGEGFIRINFAVPNETLHLAMARMEKLFEK